MAGDDDARARVDLDEVGVVADVEPAVGERQALGTVEAGHPAEIEDAAVRAHAADEAVIGR